MEELSPDVEVTLCLGSPVCENSGIPNNREIWPPKLGRERANLPLESELVLNDISNSTWETDNNFLNPESPEIASLKFGESKGNLKMSSVTENNLLVHDVPESKEDEILSVGEQPSIISSLKVEPSIINSFELLPQDSTIRLPLNAASDTSVPIAVEIKGTKNGQIVAKVITLDEGSLQRQVADDVLTLAAKSIEEYSNGPIVKASVVSVRLSKGNGPGKGGVMSIFELDYIPLWGSFSICGHRPEMEDALSAEPCFTKIPIRMFIQDCETDEITQTLTHLSCHFFGVYDGHGGSKVANYCRDRVHLALIEELKKVQDDLVNGFTTDIQHAHWEKVFTGCFSKVDDEVGGKVSRGIVEGDVDTCNHNFEPIAPGTAGSTAVVAVVCSSHIIVANCGDSRAVLYRGREAIALSSDHKPSREDEYSRIEASGGMVIQWNGYRVFGVLAMSRSIGDRYLKPCIIPDPEVRFVPRAREDECLVLASDGLWDVMTNEEVCEVARKQILIWHKKNGTSSIVNRGQGTDPAAQSAAEYLANLALQKGSKDNISVIVIDLKAQRKLKSKS